MPNCSRIWEVATEDSRPREQGSLWECKVQAAGITGDFNSDGKLDLVLPTARDASRDCCLCQGMGTGHSAPPSTLMHPRTTHNPILLAGDLNNDKKLDFIWGNAVFLGNGDGTFKQIPLTIAGSPGGNLVAVALADLNGDGTLDAVSGSGIASMPATETAHSRQHLSFLNRTIQPGSWPLET